MTRAGLCISASMVLLFAACEDQRESRDTPGQTGDRPQELLDADAAVLQVQAPLQPMGIYLAGLQVMRNDPAHQIEAHHYCTQVDADFAQCVVFDGNTSEARLTGVEFIVSERLFDQLPEDEKRYWHPLNYEILSGLLVAPDLPQAAEQSFMRGKLNAYAKSWHFWNGSGPGTTPRSVPRGEPVLGWSFNRNGEARPELMRSLAQRIRVDLMAKQRERQALTAEARPQAGVDAMKGRFEGAAQPFPGVVDRESAPGTRQHTEGQENR